MAESKISNEDRKAFSRVMTKLGAIGGRIGGKKSSANMTPEERRARALKANAASQEAKRRKKAAQQEGE